MIDLRSDTVTRPTADMVRAMTSAPLGDDVMQDDPTVQRLQHLLAERAGFEAGLFFPTGTQSNLAGLMAHCQRGDEYIVGQRAHTYKYEGGGAAVLGSIQPQPIEHAADGSLPLEKIEAAIKPVDFHFARTRLLALENTFQGMVIDAQYINRAAALARQHGLSVHLDGARVFNAAVASQQDVATVCAPFDSVSVCFSKGLGAPVGSVLLGSRDVIEQALRWRKVLGGGMRQSGLLAAACLYAMDHHVQRLADDHRRAERLAAGLRTIDELNVVYQATNMVFVDVPGEHAQALTDDLATQGVIMRAVYGGTTRLVTHLDIDDAGIERVIAGFKGYFSK
ncbi:MAG: low-specificity L-threonine aldolase [Comamonadaceae bacterium]|nr:MAG: low-specificity L-threonine aldolase [Comamonadaceae bacterium]